MIIGPGGSPPGGLTPQQIYEQLTGGPGSSSMGAAADFINREWQNEEARAKEIAALSQDIRGGWEGQAGTAALGPTGPLITNAMTGVSRLGMSEGALNQQTDAFHSASNSVVPVPEKPPESTILNDVIPWETDLDREIENYQTDAHHNVEVFGTYDTTSQAHEEPLGREYQTTSHSGGDISVSGPGDTGGTIDSDDYRDSDDPGSGNGPAPGGDGSGGGGAPGGSPGGALGGDTAGTGTHTSQVSPSTTPDPRFPNSAPPVSQHGPTSNSPVGLIGAGPPVGGTPAREGGPGGRGGAGSGGPSGRGGGTGGGPGVRSGGPGAGALAAEQAAQRGVAGASGTRGGTGMGGVPMGAAGRGKNGEDDEHQRKVLIDPDPESLFGNETLTAPQVIGDPRYEDDE